MFDMVVPTRFINHIVAVRSLEEISHVWVCTSFQHPAVVYLH